MSFAVPPLSSGINFDTSQFTGGMAQIAASAGQFPGLIAAGIDDPLRQAEGAMASAGEKASEIGSDVEHGMLSAEAAMSLFPPLVIELIENPILGAIAAVGELGEKVGEIVGEMANHFRDVGLQSMKTGLDPETFSTFAAAAKESGVEMASFANGLELLQQRAAEALAGDKQGAQGFEELGISAKQLAVMMNDPKEMLLAVATGMKDLPTQGDRVRAAMDAMGRGGKEMLPFLQQGGDGITAMAGKLGDLGARVGSEETEMGASWAKMGAEFSAMWEGVESALAKPVLEFLQQNMNDILPKVEAVAHWIGDGLSSAMQQTTQFWSTAWGVLSGVGDTLGTVILPLLEAVYPLLQLIGDVVKTIMDATAVGLNGFAGGLHLLMGDSEGADKAMHRGNDAANRVMGDIGLGNTQPTVNFEKVNITLDHDAATTQVAEKIRPAIKQGYDDLTQQLKSAAVHAKVAHAMGGRR